MRVTMQGHSVWWSVTKELYILEVSIRREREEKQVSAGSDDVMGGAIGGAILIRRHVFVLCSWRQGTTQAGQTEESVQTEQAGGVWVCMWGPRHCHPHTGWKTLHVWQP